MMREATPLGAGSACANRAEPDIDFAVDVAPLLALAEPLHELLERARVLWRVLEPGEEVEGLAEVPRVVQAPGHGRQVLEARGDVVRALLEDVPPLVLRERPPLVRLADRDQRGSRRLRPVEGLLLGQELFVLRTGHVALVAGHAAE